MKQEQLEEALQRRWAVCQEPTEEPHPKWFYSEEDAREWMGEVVAPPQILNLFRPQEKTGEGDNCWPTSDEVATGGPVPAKCSTRRDSTGADWVLIERTDGEAILRGVGAFRKSDGPVSLIHPDELPPGYRPEIRRAHQGWRYLVPIRTLADLTGERFNGPRFRDFLPLDRVSECQSSDLGAELDEILAGTHPSLACDLGPDWHFEDIRARAHKLPGHCFRGLKIESHAHQLTRIAYDVEEALFEAHPDIPSVAVAAFWNSWRVWRHFAECSSTISKVMSRQSNGSEILYGGGEAAAIDFVYRQLTCYAEEVLTLKNGIGCRSCELAFCNRT